MGSIRAAAHGSGAQVVGQTDDESIAAESTSLEAAEENNVEAESRPEPEAVSGQDQQAPYKVLIVEDATELAEVIAATLERINIATLHETHVVRALEVYHKEHPDVILLDIGLPDKTGWKLMDAIKESEEQDRPLVIVITAHGDPANRLMGKLQGVHSYLIKPFTPNEVEQVVGSALAAKIKGIPSEEDAVEEVPLPEFLLKILEGQSDRAAAEAEAASEPAMAAESTEAVEVTEAGVSTESNESTETAASPEKAAVPESEPAASGEESASPSAKASEEPADSTGSTDAAASPASTDSDGKSAAAEDTKASDS